MPSRRSLLSYVVGPAVLAGGMLDVRRASARSAAPELVGINDWLNTKAPLAVADLRGKAVMVEFWHSCIFWRRTLSYVNSLGCGVWATRPTDHRRPHPRVPF